MNRTRALAAVGALVLAACAEPTASPRFTPDGSISRASAGTEGGQYVISFKNDRVPSGFAARVEALGGSVVAAYDGVGVAVVAGLDAMSASKLSDLGEVGADQTFQILDPDETPDAVEGVGADAAMAPSSIANPAGAFFFARQWNMRLVKADAAWAAGKLGSPAVKVAILDTGIDYLHPDLVGHVDLANSASFVPSDDALVAKYFPTRNVVTDLHYHGTHVAATVSSNAVAAAGVTSRTTLMAVKVLSASGGGSTSGTLAGIVYAADHGADVINMSLGNQNLPFDMKDKEIKDFFNKVVDRGFKYAHSKGVTIVVSAGNEKQNLDVAQTFKPYCGAMHVICVSAVGPTAGGTNGPWVNADAFASYSNYGQGMIDVAAPGGNTGGAVYEACSTSSLQIPVCRTGTYVVGLSGTSMASPHVAGLAALVIADRTGGRAGGAIRSAIFNTAVDLGAAGKDPYFGNGRIDVARALGLQ